MHILGYARLVNAAVWPHSAAKREQPDKIGYRLVSQQPPHAKTEKQRKRHERSENKQRKNKKERESKEKEKGPYRCHWECQLYKPPGLTIYFLIIFSMVTVIPPTAPLPLTHTLSRSLLIIPYSTLCSQIWSINASALPAASPL